MYSSSRRLRLLSGVAAMAFAVTACGGDGDADAGQAPDDATVAETDDATAAETDDAAAAETDDAETDAADDGGTDADVADLEPVELTAQSYLGEAAALGQLAGWFYEQVTERTGGAVTFDEYWDGSLIEALGIRDAVADGRLDVGQATHAYNPDDFPITNVTSVPFVTDNVPAVTAALTQLYHADEQYRAEWEGQGLRLIAFLGVPPSVLGTTEPIESIGDLGGQQIRGVDRFIPALEAVGANPVSLTAFEVYEALERGTISGHTGVPLDIAGALSLHEVAPYVVDMGQGVYAGAYLAMSLSSWEGLDPAVQQVIDEVAAEIPSQIGGMYEAGEAAACTTFQEGGGEVSLLPEAEVEAWSDAIGDSVFETWQSAVDGAGGDADAIWEEYQSLVETAEAEYDYSSGLVTCADGS